MRGYLTNSTIKSLFVILHDCISHYRIAYHAVYTVQITVNNCGQHMTTVYCTYWVDGLVTMHLPGAPVTCGTALATLPVRHAQTCTASEYLPQQPIDVRPITLITNGRGALRGKSRKTSMIYRLPVAANRWSCFIRRKRLGPVEKKLPNLQANKPLKKFMLWGFFHRAYLHSS